MFSKLLSLEIFFLGVVLAFIWGLQRMGQALNHLWDLYSLGGRKFPQFAYITSVGKAVTSGQELIKDFAFQRLVLPL